MREGGTSYYATVCMRDLSHVTVTPSTRYNLRPPLTPMRGPRGGRIEHFERLQRGEAWELCGGRGRGVATHIRSRHDR